MILYIIVKTLTTGYGDEDLKTIIGIFFDKSNAEISLISHQLQYSICLKNTYSSLKQIDNIEEVLKIMEVNSETMFDLNKYAYI